MRQLLIYLWMLYACFGELIAQNPLSKQNEKLLKNTLQVHWGIHHSKSQDLVYSPMIYQGVSPLAFGLAYERQSQNGLHRFSFNIDQIEVKGTELISSPVIKRQVSEAIQASINYGYLAQLMKKGKLTLLLGGLLEAKFHHLVYNMGFGDEEGYFYENSISPWINASYQLNPKTNVQANLRLPILSFIARPEYAIVDNRQIQGENGLSYLYKKGTFVSWGEYQAANLSAEVNRALSPTFCLFARYQFQYFRFEQPEPITVLKNNLDVGISFKF